ncbi:unnamed protein product [Didymodactylos carnosus]|uniref:Uncharacterized protein n=1 Tax=Didymodactylos carnosus TaxID=1234261 RepID=A0A8S2K0L4_9BILA|nr:unnamed protein product [Didymodactylos carnosus]CAF3821056.1 unnamed protein product [Didymodactylos carnosus]
MITIGFTGPEDTLIKSVSFEINIDKSFVKYSYANVAGSAEDKILFSTDTVFQIKSVQYDSVNGHWQVKFELTEMMDKKIVGLIKYFLPDPHSNLNEHMHIVYLGFYLWRMGHENKAERYYKLVLSSLHFNSFNWVLKFNCYTYLGMLYCSKDHVKALKHYEMAAKIAFELPRKYTALKKYELARRFIRSAPFALRDMVEYSIIDVQIGRTYMRRNENDMALEILDKTYKYQLKNLPDYHAETAVEAKIDLDQTGINIAPELSLPKSELQLKSKKDRIVDDEDTINYCTKTTENKVALYPIEFYCGCKNDMYEQIEKWLMQLRVSDINRLGSTTSIPLHAASYYVHEKIIKMVSAHSASRSILNKYKQTPCQEAKTFQIQQLFYRLFLTDRFLSSVDEWTDPVYDMVTTCLSTMRRGEY